MEKFTITRKSVTTWQGSTVIEAETLAEALELAEEVENEDWTDDTESDGGYGYSEEGGQFFVTYAGQYVRIMANSRQSALYQTQQDYNRPPAKQLLDWKDSEHTAEEWDIIKN